MDRTTAFGYVVGPTGLRGFVDQNLATGVDGTDAVAADAMAWQEELMGVIEGAGLVGSSANLKQVWAAIQQYVANNTRSTTLVPILNATTFIVPANIYWLDVVLTGGGGGGGAGTAGAGGGGGGAGGTCIATLAVAPGQAIVVTIGAGGAGGVAGGANAGAGGTSSFGTLMTATGGTPGANSPNSYAFGGSPGGSPQGGVGSEGGWGTDGQAGANMYPGNGGASWWGGGGRGGVGGGQTGTAYGSGGGGAYSIAGNGGAGQQGICLVRY